MDSVCPSELTGRQEGLIISVAVLRGRRPDTDTLIRYLGVESQAIRLRANRNRPDPALPAGPDNTDGYFPPIGNQYFVHCCVVSFLGA